MYVKMTVSQEKCFHIILFLRIMQLQPFLTLCELHRLSPNKTGNVLVVLIMWSSECDIHVEPLFTLRPPFTVATMWRSALLPKAVLKDEIFTWEVKHKEKKPINRAAARMRYNFTNFLHTMLVNQSDSCLFTCCFSMQELAKTGSAVSEKLGRFTVCSQ